jgi:hypothetical protein
MMTITDMLLPSLSPAMQIAVRLHIRRLTYDANHSQASTFGQNRPEPRPFTIAGPNRGYSQPRRERIQVVV